MIIPKYKLGNIVKFLVATLALAIVLADIYCELIGLPDFARQAVQKRLATHGISVEAESIRAGALTGIVFENLTVWDAQAPDVQIATARKLAIQPRRFTLLTGTLTPRNLIISDASVFLPTTPNNKPEKPPLVVKNIDTRLAFRNTTVSISRFSANTVGGKILLTGKLRNWSHLAAGSTETGSTGTLSWNNLPNRLEPKIYDRFAYIREVAAKQMLNLQNNFLQGTFDINLTELSKSHISGTGQLSGIAISNVPVEKIKVRFAYEENSLHVSNFQLVAGFKSAVSGELSLNLHSRMLKGKIRGRFNPKLTYRALDRPMPRWLAEIRLATPPWFDLQIKPSKLNLNELEVDGQFNAHNVIYRSCHLRKVSGKFAHTPDLTELQQLRVDFGKRATEYLAGDLQMADMDPELISGDIEGKVSPRTIISMLRTPSPKIKRASKDLVFADDLPSVTCRLKNSGLSLHKLNLDIELNASNFRFRDLPIKKITLPVTINSGVLKTTPAVTLETDSDNPQALTAKTTLDLKEKRISANGEIQVYPHRLCQALRIFQDKKFLKKLTMRGPPARFDFTLKKSPLLEPEKWHTQFALKASRLSYDGLDFEQVDASGTINKSRLKMNSATARSPAAKIMKVTSLELDLTRPELMLTGECQADPLAVDAFIVEGRPRELYRKLWKNFQWGNSAPHAVFDKLHFREFPSGRWSLRIQARIKDKDLTYRGIDADRAEVYLDTELPARVTLKELHAVAGDQELKGWLDFKLAGDPMLFFDCHGQYDPFQAFSAAAPEIKEQLRPFDVADNTATTLKGSVHLRGDPRPRMQARLQGDWLDYHQFHFENFTAEWQMVEHELKYNLPEAKLSDGTVAISGFHNRFFGNGRLKIELQDAKLGGLIDQLQKEPVEKDYGLLSCKATLDLHRRQNDNPLHINGQGEIKIREGNLWNAPILHRLGETLGIASLGQITQLDAKVDFTGNEAVIPEFTTDGTILALSGKGSYNWVANDLNFKVYGQALKPTSLVPLVLKPLSWFFEAELKGSPKEYKWQLLGPLRRMLPGGKN